MMLATLKRSPDTMTAREAMAALGIRSLTSMRWYRARGILVPVGRVPRADGRGRNPEVFARADVERLAQLRASTPRGWPGALDPLARRNGQDCYAESE